MCKCCKKHDFPLHASKSLSPFSTPWVTPYIAAKTTYFHFSRFNQKLWWNFVPTHVSILLARALISCPGPVPNPLEPDSELLTVSRSLDPKVSEIQEACKTETKTSNRKIYGTRKSETSRKSQNRGNHEIDKVQKIGKSRKSENRGNEKVE
jgi:hypothetical protein